MIAWSSALPAFEPEEMTMRLAAGFLHQVQPMPVSLIDLLQRRATTGHHNGFQS